MALILNIETATEVCSVALSNEQGLLDYRENNEGKSHASLLTKFIEELLSDNHLSAQQLSAVAVSSGPGSYTGLRIGVSAAKGICYGANIPLIAIPTLQSMAAGFIEKNLSGREKEFEDAWFCPMIDARRLEVYTSFFDIHGQAKAKTSAEIIDNHSFQEILSQRKVLFFGNGSGKCREIIVHPNALFYEGFSTSAMYMIKLAETDFNALRFKDVAYFEPYYLKDFIATVPRNKVLK